jgi:nucleoside-diphosphate-sugar epimerase
LIEGDLRDLEVTRRAAEGAEFVLHQGALPSVPGTPESKGLSTLPRPPPTATRPNSPSANR